MPKAHIFIQPAFTNFERPVVRCYSQDWAIKEKMPSHS